MKMRQLTGIVCAALVLLNPSARVMVQADTRQPIEDIRKELLQLPYYSVFDFLAFSYDRGTVVVGGYAYALGLKRDAERAIKRVQGGRFVLLAASDLTHGHGTHTWAALWQPDLAQLLRSSAHSESR